MSLRRQRDLPAGLTYVAALSIVYAIVAVSLVLMGVQSIRTTTSSSELDFLVVASLLGASYVVLGGAFGLGATALAAWAWPAGVIAQAIGVATAVLIVIHGGSGPILAQVIFRGLVPVAVFLYLVRPDVRAAFGRR